MNGTGRYNASYGNSGTNRLRDGREGVVRSFLTSFCFLCGLFLLTTAGSPAHEALAQSAPTSPARDDSYQIPEDEVLSVVAPGVLENDADVSESPNVGVRVRPSNGKVTPNPDGSFDYTPKADFNGTDTFQYRAVYSGGRVRFATVSITVQPVKDAPVAKDDSYTVTEGQTLQVPAGGVLSNDTDADGDTLLASSVLTRPQHGSLSLAQDGSFVYRPARGYFGPDSFEYTARDGKGGTDTARVSLSVTSNNSPPVASGATLQTDEDTPLNIVLRATDADRDTLTYSVSSQPAHGTLGGTAPNLTYTPDADYFGTDSFTFRASDSEGQSNLATVNVKTSPVNDAPSFTAGADQQTREDAGFQNVKNWASSISVGPANEAGQTRRFEITENDNPSLFSEGPGVTPSGTLFYRTTPGGSGVANLKVRLVDNGTTVRGGRNSSEEKEFSITVSPVNDRPKVSATNDGPIDEGEEVTITASATDVEGDDLIYRFDCNANEYFRDTGDTAKSSEAVGGCVFDDSGEKIVNVRVNDGNLGRRAATTITVDNVAPTGTLRNTGPVDEGDSVEVSFDDANGTSTVTDPSQTDTDAGFRYEYACDGTFDSSPDYASASASPTFSCDANQSGTKTIAARVIDKDGGSTTYTTDVTVNNVEPTVSLSGPTRVEESATVERTYDFTVTDPGDDTFTVASGYPVCGANGSLVGGSLVTDADGGSFDCIFPDGDSTSDVEIKVSDSDGATDTDDQRVTVTVDNVGPTVSLLGDGTALEGQTKTFTYTIEDPGTDPDPTVAESCGAADYTDTPADDSFDCTFRDGDGADGTDYEVGVTADDNDGDSAADTKTVTVDNVVPEVTASGNTTADEGESVTFEAGSFTDPGADGPWNVTVDWGDDSTDTSFTMTSPGEIPAQDHTYTDDGTYNVTVTVAEDGQNAPSGQGTSSVEVANVVPVAEAQSVTTGEGTDKTVTLTGRDVAADPLTFRVTSLPANGKLYDGSGTGAAEISSGDLPYELGGSEVTYEPTPDYAGSDSFEFTACDDASPASCDVDGATVSLTIRQSNSQPTATDDTKSTDEDEQLVFPASDLVANDSAGPGESDQTLEVTSVSGPQNGTVDLANGQVTFTPDPDFNGAASFEYTVEDDGLTDGADDFKTDTGRVDVTVDPINDSPVASNDSFTTDEDESLALSSDDLFSNDSDVDGDTLALSSVSRPVNGTVSTNDGTPTFTPDADYNGPASFDYTVEDGNGGTSTARVNIAVSAVNDAPEASDDPVTLDEDTSTTFDPKTNDSAGPANESSQTLSVGRFPDAPDHGSATVVTSGNDTGKVRYTPNADYSGSDSFTYEVCDSGSPNLCDTATVSVTVIPVNDAPVADDESFGGAFRAVGNTSFVSDDPDDAAPDPVGPQKTIRGDILAGDSDVDGDTLSVVGGTFSTSDGGTVTLQSDGDFVFYPKAGTSCADNSDSFDYTVTDSRAPTAGTDRGTVTVEVQDCVWYLDSSASANGNGGSQQPFSSLSGVNGANDADASGQTIFLYPGSYSGGLVLEGGQKLLSKQHGLSVPDGGSGSVTLEAAATGGAESQIRDGLALGQNNTVQGVSLLSNPSGASLYGGAVGNATVNTQTAGSVSNEVGKAVDISGGNLNMNFTGVSSSGSATDGIRLDNVSGTFLASDGSIQNAGDQDIDISGDRWGDNLNFTYGGTVVDDLGTLVNVSGQTGGTKDFYGQISDGNDGDGGGVSITNNVGSAVRFFGSLTLSTGGNTAFNAISGGTVTASPTGSTQNTIATTSGTALNVQNTVIGSGNLVFKSISVNGAANGMVLSDTGISGGLKVTGDGANTQNGSGGTIQNTSFSGASLSNTSFVSLKQMNFTNANSVDGGSAVVCDNTTNSGCNGAIKLTNVSGFRAEGMVINGAEEMGIRGVNVIDMDIVGSRITNAGDEPNENGISVYGLHGSIAGGSDSTISNTTVTGNALGDDTVFIRNSAPSLVDGRKDTLTVSGSTFTNPGSPAELGDGIHVSLKNTANFETIVRESTFTQNTLRNGADGIQVDAGNTSVSNVSITGNTFNGIGWNQSGILISGSGTSRTTYAVSNNPQIKGGVGSGIIALANGDGASMIGTISGNTVTTTEPETSGYGIWIQAEASGDRHISSVTNNTVTGFTAGLSAYARESARTDLTLTGNTLTAGGRFPLTGAMLDAGNGEPGAPRLCVNFGSTPTNNISGTMSGISDYLLTMYENSTFQVQGLTGDGTSASNVNAFVSGKDIGGAVVDSQGGSVTGYTNATCATP